MNHETELNIISKIISRAYTTIMTGISIACGRHITTLAMIFFDSILLAALACFIITYSFVVTRNIITPIGERIDKRIGTLTCLNAFKRLVRIHYFEFTVDSACFGSTNYWRVIGGFVLRSFSTFINFDTKIYFFWTLNVVADFKVRTDLIFIIVIEAMYS